MGFHVFEVKQRIRGVQGKLLIRLLIFTTQSEACSMPETTLLGWELLCMVVQSALRRPWKGAACTVLFQKVFCVGYLAAPLLLSTNSQIMASGNGAQTWLIAIGCVRALIWRTWIKVKPLGKNSSFEKSLLFLCCLAPKRWGKTTE